MALLPSHHLFVHGLLPAPLLLEESLLLELALVLEVALVLLLALVLILLSRLLLRGSLPFVLFLLLVSPKDVRD
jgi:hypothetical protein